MNKMKVCGLPAILFAMLVSVGVLAHAAAVPASKGKMVTKSVTVGNFTAIDASTGVKVIYTQAAVSPAVVTAPADVMDRVVVEVKNNTLIAKVKTERKFFGMVNKDLGDDVTVSVSVPAVGKFKASSGADIKCPRGMMVHGTVKVIASSSGDIDFGVLSATQVVMSTSSSGDINIVDLRADGVSCSASSGSDVDVKAIKSGSVALTTSSGSDIEVESLTAREVVLTSSSGSHIEIVGRADVVTVSASSGADIECGRLVTQRCTGAASSGAEIKVNAATSSVTTSSGGSYRSVR